MKNLVCMCAVAVVAIAFTATDAHARRCGGRRNCGQVNHCHARPQVCNTCAPAAAVAPAAPAKTYEAVGAPPAGPDVAPAPAPAPAAPAAAAPAAPAPAPAAPAPAPAAEKKE